jgi:thiamine-monophosphate kinase
MVVTTDMMVQGPDFRLEYSSGYDLGFKAAATNLSDVAAMGARPSSLIVALAAPSSTPITLVEEFARGLREACGELAPGCGVVGGDLSTSSVLTIAVTALGDLEGREPILRSGAQVGDQIAVAGVLGYAAVGLAELFAGKLETGHPNALAAQIRPRSPIASGKAAALAGATAGLDVSDSLVMDAGRIARESKVVLRLDEDALDAEAATLAIEVGIDASTARQAILFGGEDHALLMTFPAGTVLPEGFRSIGRVDAVDDDLGPHVNLGGAPVPENGWNPFTGWNGVTS